VSKPTKEADPEFVKGPDLGREAIRETAKELKTEAAREVEAEDLRGQALEDRIRDVERAARIEHLEAGDDLLNEVNQDTATGPFAQRGWHSDRKKIKPAKVEKGWFAKTDRAQRRGLQKKLGSYRPEPDDPISQRRPAKSVAEGSLFDLHPLSRVRIRDVEATSTIRANIPLPLPVKPVHPGAAEAPIPGRCWECYTPLRKRDRAGTKFCTHNMGDCRRRYNSREADRAERAKLFNDWWISRHGSVYEQAAATMTRSAIRCGIDATFTATADGVLAVHDQPLPPVVPKAIVRFEAPGGYALPHVEATATDTGTLYTFDMPRMDGDVAEFWASFEGDPGVARTDEEVPVLPPLPPGAAMYAARNGRTAEFLMARKRDLAA